MPDALKDKIRAWRSHGWMKKGGPSKPAHQRALEKMSRLELAVAAANPDHSDAARSAAENELRGRGGVADEVIPVMPGFVKPANADDLRKRFFGWSRMIRKYMGLLIFLGFLGALVAVGFAEELKAPALREALEGGLITQAEFDDRFRDLTTEEYTAAVNEGVEFESAFPSDASLEEVLLHRYAAQTPSGRNQVLAQSIGYSLIAVFVIALFTWMLTSFLRRQPARLLLLRKFNDKDLAKSMERVIQSELRPFGHIATLSDKYIKRSRWGWLSQIIPTNFLHGILIVIWLPIRFVLRRFNRARYGPPYVGSARDFRNLAKRLRDRIGLNIEVAMTSKEAFIVRTHDNWWKEVVALLMGSADIIVVDLSNVTSGTEWELERLDRMGMFEHAVLTAHQDRIDVAREAADRFPGSARRHIFSYDQFGDMAEREAFRTAMLETMAFVVAQKSRKPMVRN